MCGGAIISDFILCSQQRRPVAAADLWPNSPFARVPSFNSNFGDICCDDSLLNSKESQAQSSAGDDEKKPNLYRGIRQRPRSKL